MYFYTFILILLSTSYAATQTNGSSTCTVWGDPHLTGFPVDPRQAGFRSSYWCQWAGRMLILKNEFIEFYVNVTSSPYWSEYYEIYLLSNGSVLCTITPDTENCPEEFVQVRRPRNSPNGRQIFYLAADDMEISITSYWINDRLGYNIEVTQSYTLILASTGLCVTRRSECILETSSVRKRSTDEATAYEVCNVFIAEANKTAKRFTGETSSRLIANAREACVTDVLFTNNIAWGESAVWLVLTDSIRQIHFSRAQQKDLMMDISSNVAEAVENARPKAESIMGISTTAVLSDTVESMTEISTTTTFSNTTNSILTTPIMVSSCSTNKFKQNLILPVLVLLVVAALFIKCT